MKQITIKWLSFVLSVVLLLGCSSAALAEADVAGLAEQIAAQPDYSAVEPDVAAEDFEQNLLQAMTLAQTLLALSEEDLAAVENSEKAFLNVCILAGVYLETRLPAGEITEENWREYLQFYVDFMLGAAAADSLAWSHVLEVASACAEHTALVEDPEDPESGLIPAGYLYLSNVGNAVLTVSFGFVSWLAQQPEERQIEASAALLHAIIAILPEEVTVENFFDTATLLTALAADDQTQAVVDYLDAEDTAKLEKCRNDMQTVLTEQKDELAALLAAEIDAVCDPAVLEGDEDAMMELAMSGALDELDVKISLLMMLDEDGSILDKIDNLDLFTAVSNAVYEWMYPVIFYGDLNGDGAITASDALFILKLAVGKVEMTDELFELADLNGDYDVTASDALLVLKYTVNKIDVFPVEEYEYDDDIIWEMPEDWVTFTDVA